VLADALDELLTGPALSVVFQPIVDLRSAEPYGYEVLGRCRALAGPLAEVSRDPASLLELASHHGRLLRLDRRWRELAFDIIAEEKGFAGPFFLNVDPRVIEDPEYTPGYTLSLAARHKLPPARFVLELTELASRDPDAVERVLAHYSSQGFRVALDDLGAGQQSLVTLLRVAPEIVKLDRDLVRSVDTDPARGHLLLALSEFARRTGIQLIAEGIETLGELRAVIAAGVPFGQGFLLGRPGPRPLPLDPRIQATLREEVAACSPAKSPRRLHMTRDPGALLLELIETLRVGHGTPSIFEHVIACAAALSGAERVSLHLAPEGRAEAGCDDCGVEAALIDRALAQRTPMRVDRVRDAPPGSPPALRTILIVPLIDHCGPLGALTIASTAAASFDASAERWLTIAAGVAAPALRAALRQGANASRDAK
jgi:EAL domain-containing protein (putative c-di-GMP-specific phosphodiesterase class I)